jgi:glycosyltransferase involved in cell wall biosynthesis
MSNPRISVVMAAFNAEETIGEALASLVEQTVREIEILVVDDGSTDGTAEVVRGFRPEGVDVRLLSQTNAGPSAARNHGLREARGELVAFMDADDWSLPWRFAHQLRLVEAYPEAAAILCEIAMTDEQASQEPLFSLDKVRELTLLDFAASDNLGGTGASMCRTEALRAVGGFDPRLWNGEDYELWTRVVARYQVVRYENPVLRVRHDPESLSSSFERAFPQVTTLMYKVFGKDGVFKDHRHYARVLKAHQYDHLSWMAFREGRRATALRLLGTSVVNTMLGRLRLPKADYPSGHLPLLVRYLVGKPPEPGEV